MNPIRTAGHCARLDSIRCDTPAEFEEQGLDRTVARLSHGLDHCPYCGAANEGPARGFPLGICQVYRRGSHVWRVVCDNCSAEGPPGDEPEEAATAWNERTPRTLRILGGDGARRFTRSL